MQISKLGRVLDKERELIPVEARKKLLEPSKPGEPQRHGHGAYTTAPIAEDL